MAPKAASWSVHHYAQSCCGAVRRRSASIKIVDTRSQHLRLSASDRLNLLRKQDGAQAFRVHQLTVAITSMSYHRGYPSPLSSVCSRATDPAPFVGTHAARSLPQERTKSCAVYADTVLDKSIMTTCQSQPCIRSCVWCSTTAIFVQNHARLGISVRLKLPAVPLRCSYELCLSDKKIDSEICTGNDSLGTSTYLPKSLHGCSYLDRSKQFTFLVISLQSTSEDGCLTQQVWTWRCCLLEILLSLSKREKEIIERYDNDMWQILRTSEH
jgi:hypothetical protein